MRVLHGHVVDALRELSDESYQRRVWTASAGPEISSFVECVCHLFDDSGLGDELDRGGAVYAVDIDQDLRLLRRELRRIDGLRPPEELLNDPVLQHVRSSAAALLTRVGDSRTNA